VLALSGVLGAGLGDVLYFHSLALIGPRLSMTIVSTAPVGTALIALLPPLRERMSVAAVAGMLLAVGGVVWVVAERRGREAWPAEPEEFRRGVLLGVASVVCLSAGFVASRAGMNAFGAAPVPALSATLVRVTAAGVFCWAGAAALGRLRATAAPFFAARNFLWLLAGVAVGPVVGIWFSMVALQGVPGGVATTLISLSPIVLVFLSWAAYGERPTWRRVLGTLMALGGVALLVRS
jgi:drug/metabolite transporter (DMT)-like permease